MTSLRPRLMAMVVVALTTAGASGQDAHAPETVSIRSGTLTLRGWLWRPQGAGPFPAIAFNHGSYGTEAGDTLDPADAGKLGRLFADHGYVFLLLCRRGVGLSQDAGPPEGTLMDRARVAHGQEGRNKVQLQLLGTEALDASYLPTLAGVDPRRIGMAGHSFGGAITLLDAARDTTLRAAVVFGGAAASWGRSPGLRRRLLDAIRRTSVPVLFLHAANDYSTEPGKALAAEMQRLGKPARLKIYPAVGESPGDGHNFLFRDPAIWQDDVFAFLADSMKP